MVRQALAGNITQAQKLHYKTFEITEQLFADGNPGGVKVSLNVQNIMLEKMRLPLHPVSDGLRQRITTETQAILA